MIILIEQIRIWVCHQRISFNLERSRLGDDVVDAMLQSNSNLK
jgi:hypothetical protein